jgi:hypothetical protein
MRVFSWSLKLFGFMLAFTSLWAWLPFVSSDMRLDATGVIFLFVVGAVCYLIGMALDKRVKPPKTKVVVLKPNDISFISKALNKQKRTLLILGLSLLIFDILILLAATHGNEKDEPIPVIPIILGGATILLLAGVAIVFLYKSFKMWNTNETRVYKKLTKTPQLITGLTAYFIQKEDAPGKMGLQILAEVSIKDENLEKINVSEEQLSLLRQYVHLHSPNALYNEKEIKLH